MKLSLRIKKMIKVPMPVVGLHVRDGRASKGASFCQIFAITKRFFSAFRRKKVRSHCFFYDVVADVVQIYVVFSFQFLNWPMFDVRFVNAEVRPCS